MLAVSGATVAPVMPAAQAVAPPQPLPCGSRKKDAAREFGHNKPATARVRIALRKFRYFDLEFLGDIDQIEIEAASRDRRTAG